MAARRTGRARDDAAGGRIPKLHIKKNDLVQVISGDDLGKRGRVLEVDPRARRVVVEGVNIIKKHTKPTPTNPTGGVAERPGPIHLSKVMLVCPSCDKPVRPLKSRSGDGSAIRVCRRCDKAID